MAVSRRIAAASALAAAFSMSATSALAVDLPASAAPAAVYETDRAQGHGWNPYRYRRNRVDAGDVLAGVLILGTIAAVASAAKKNSEREYRYPDGRYPDGRAPYPQDRQRYDSRAWDDNSSGLDRAVDMCVEEVERGRGRVDTVEGANRTGEGWDVRGRLEGGAPFSCRIGNDGRISDIDADGGRADAAPVDDRQYDADVYARARSSVPGAPPAGEVDDRPVWTGDERAQAPAGGDDGRYGVSATPDFDQAG
ncbi:hypothetical protein [Tsuneonella sp. HG222]